MKVILINGSPNKNGCTYTALSEVANALNTSGIETEIFHLKKEPIFGCTACGVCRKGNGCFAKDIVNDFGEKAKTADGFIFGSPVHYAGISGQLKSFMDRLFFSSGAFLKGKVAGAVVSCRRAGSTAALEQLLKYFSINQMPIVSSQYWTMVHGATPADVEKDLEGMQTMRVLGNNAAWLIKCIEAGKKAGLDFPTAEPRKWTNFIRVEN